MTDLKKIDFNKKHTLAEFVSILEEKGLLAAAELKDKAGDNVEHISFSSSDIVEGTLFICKGVHFKEEYLKDALAQGALAYVSDAEHDVPDEVPYIIVKDIREAMAYIADFYYNGVQNELKIFAITGTKGKSTTTFFAKSILDEHAKETGEKLPAMLSTIWIYDGIEDIPSRLTTPEAFNVYKHLKNAYDSGIKYAVMEVSSQAIKYHRVTGIDFEAGCFTNIGEDHISPVEHPDFEDYFGTKIELFSRSKTAVVNLSTDKSDLMLKGANERSEKVVTFGFTPDADVYAYDIVSEGETSTFRVRTKNFDDEFTINMWGHFNVENAIGAIALCSPLGVSKEAIKKGLENTQVEGRVQIYHPKHKKLSIIVDYAHNKMSFRTLAESTKAAFPDSKISVVFGTPGDKAFNRRKDLGEIAGKYTDFAYITEDDPGYESPAEICAEISKHVAAAGGEYKIILDRREAIKAAIKETAEGGVVLVIGKGAETSQKRGSAYVDTPSDGEYVQDILEKENI